MKEKVIFAVSLFLFVFICHAVFSMEDYRTNAEEAQAYNVTRVVKDVDGLKFRVQEDMPIEKIGGVYRPIDIDSYVAMKFNTLDAKINEAFSILGNKINELSAKVEELTKKVEELSKEKNLTVQNQTVSAP